MHVVNSMVANFGKINLDTSALGMRSVSKTDIKLPYSGALPEQMAVPSSAYVYFNVQLVQGVRLVLVVKGSGKDIKCPLEATNEEIVALLDKFFDQSQSETGMVPYWLGLWQAHYIEWRKISTQPDRLLEILSTLSMSDLEFLKKNLMDMPATE